MTTAGYATKERWGDMDKHWEGDAPMEDIHQMVKHIVQTYQTNDPFRISQTLHIHLLPSRTPPGLWGVFIFRAPHAFFNYDMTQPGTLQSTYVAHGLAHYFLHREHCPLFIEREEPDTSVFEAEARAFVDDLLFGTGIIAMSTNPHWMN